jgi:hypothetical protein
VNRTKSWVTGIGAAALGALALAMTSCRSTFPRRDPTNEPFPSVVGESLSGVRVPLPDAFRGKPVVLLVGYLQESQFDIDRWLFGLTDAGVSAAVREVPTIPGLAPRVFAGWIDSGMRRGIPQEDWGSVVTVYADAARIAEFTGNEEGLPGRVLLLDAEGRVAFFHDRGYSVAALGRLRAALARLDADGGSR